MNKVVCTFYLVLNLSLPLSKLQNFIVLVCKDSFLKKFLFVQADSFLYTDWVNPNTFLAFTSEEWAESSGNMSGQWSWPVGPLASSCWCSAYRGRAGWGQLLIAFEVWGHRIDFQALRATYLLLFSWMTFQSQGLCGTHREDTQGRYSRIHWRIPSHCVTIL